MAGTIAPISGRKEAFRKAQLSASLLAMLWAPVNMENLTLYALSILLFIIGMAEDNLIIFGKVCSTKTRKIPSFFRMLQGLDTATITQQVEKKVKAKNICYEGFFLHGPRIGGYFFSDRHVFSLTWVTSSTHPKRGKEPSGCYIIVDFATAGLQNSACTQLCVSQQKCHIMSLFHSCVQGKRRN